MNNAERAILKTLLYSTIFHFPLTQQQLWSFLITRHPITKPQFSLALKKLFDEKIIFSLQEKYITLQKNISIPDIRLVEEKRNLAKKIAYIISFLPTVSLIGISGGVAIGNIKKSDDIDFFIITKKNALWITRLCLLLCLECLGIRQKNREQREDTICLNLFLSEVSLKTPKHQQDLFTAHEIVQMIPLFSEGNMYERFLQINNWVLKFLPNAYDNKKKIFIHRTPMFLPVTLFLAQLLTFCESVARIIQLIIVRRKKNKYVFTDYMLVFYDQMFKYTILRLYRKRLQEYNKIL